MILRCPVCLELFEIKKKLCNQMFCSLKCKAQERRDSGVDDIIKDCEKCNKPFISNKYAKQRFCGRKCMPWSLDRYFK